jgi:hypothetical protein
LEHAIGDPLLKVAVTSLEGGILFLVNVFPARAGGEYPDDGLKDFEQIGPFSSGWLLLVVGQDVSQAVTLFQSQVHALQHTASKRQQQFTRKALVLGRKLIPDIENAAKQLAASKEHQENAELVNRSLIAIKLIYKERRGSIFQRAADLVEKHPYEAGVGIYALSCLSLWTLLLGLYPLGLLRVNDLLRPLTAPLPSWLGGDKVSLRTFTLVGFFNYAPRVLDAWVAVHRQEAWNRFERRDTVRDRRVHVPIPVQIDDTPVPELGPQHLQAAFSAAKVRLLIWGEGGAGKTSLACQLARWAMDNDNSRRLTRHPMLPVLIEDELTAGGEAGKRLVETVRGQIGDLTGTSEPVPENCCCSCCDSGVYSSSWTTFPR